MMALDAESEQETCPGEYYLDSLAVLPSFRGRGVDMWITFWGY